MQVYTEKYSFPLNQYIKEIIHTILICVFRQRASKQCFLLLGGTCTYGNGPYKAIVMKCSLVYHDLTFALVLCFYGVVQAQINKKS